MPYQTTYGSREQSLAEAIADALVARGVVGGASGTGGTSGSTAATPTAITPTLYTVPLTNASQEYSQAIANAKSISFQVLSGGDIRYSYETGRVATSSLPYYPLRAGTEEVEDLPSGTVFNGTLYLASNTAGTIVIIKVWT